MKPSRWFSNLCRSKRCLSDSATSPSLPAASAFGPDSRRTPSSRYSAKSSPICPRILDSRRVTYVAGLPVGVCIWQQHKAREWVGGRMGVVSFVGFRNERLAFFDIRWRRPKKQPTPTPTSTSSSYGKVWKLTVLKNFMTVLLRHMPTFNIPS